MLAITGATGFVGKTVIRIALENGFAIRALTRRPQEPRAGVVWVEGALDNADALDELVRGSNAVIHIAGVVNAPDRAGFEAGNVDGTTAIAQAAEAAGIPRFIHVSSLSAREPALSTYGWSKAGAEAAVIASTLEWTMVRPPAIYGPEDTEMLDMFRMAQRGIVLLPPPGRLSIIEVSDLARLLLALIPDRSTIGRIYEADDGVDNGWSHKGFAKALGEAVGKRVSTIATPKPLLKFASSLDRFTRRAKAKLTADRVEYFCHPDWVVDPTKRPPSSIWTPRIETRQGLAETATWYQRKGWMR